jgi:hypothetical protein
MASMGNAQRGALGGLAKLGEGARTTSDLSRVGGGLSRGANEGKKLNAAPWSDTFPAAGATLDLDFANNRGFVRGVGQGGVMDAITFTRASKGSYVGEDGLLKGMVRNLLGFTEDFDNAVWTKINTTISANTQTAPNGTLTADKIIETATVGSHYIRQIISVNASSEYTISFYIKAGERTKCEIWSHEGSPRFSASIDLVAETITANANVGTATYISSSINDEGDGWYRCSVTGTYGSAFNASISFLVFSDTGQQVYGGDGTSGIFIWGAQLELGSTATEYFPTNFGEPRFDWASTDSTGAGTIADPRIIPLRANPTSNGILIEEARTNRLLWNRDATQTQWVKTNITATKDQTGIDGVANAASSLTATDDNGTCIQTITLAAGNRTGSVYLKRLTGTGNIQVTLDGSTYSTVELSDTEWYRIVLSGSVTNPTVGIKIAVDGDAVAMDYGQVEDGLFVTSPILTTTATATRAVESASLSSQNWVNNSFGTFFIINSEYQGSNFANSPSLGLAGPSLALFPSSDGNIVVEGTGSGALFRPWILNKGILVFDGNGSYGMQTRLPYKVVISYSQKSVVYSVNGKTANGQDGVNSRNFSTGLPDMKIFYILAGITRCIKNIIYYPKEINSTIAEQMSK